MSIRLSLLLMSTMTLAIADDRIPTNLDTHVSIEMPDTQSVLRQREWVKQDLQGIPETPMQLPSLDNVKVESNPQALAELFEKADTARMPEALREKQNQLMVFVSTSIPKASLQRIARDSEQYHAALVLRGLINNSLQETRAYVSNMGGFKWEINPEAYDHFQIKHVPTTVVYDGEDWLGVPGDVSMEYALDKLGAQPGWQAIIEKLKHE